MSQARTLEPWRWIGIPMVQALLATVLFGIPIRIFGLALPEPVFPMAAVFAWGVIRPSVIAPVAIVIMGLALDVFWGGPFGLWALAFLVAYGVILASRSMISGQGRAALWGFYGVVTAIAFGVGVLVAGMKDKNLPGLIPLAWQYLATIVLYPFADRLIEMFDDADVRFR